MSNPTKVSWTDATTNTDGSAITAGEITGYSVGVRLATGTTGTYAYTDTAPSTATSVLLSALTPALPYGVSLVAGVQSTGPTDSPWGESAPFTLAAPVPSAVSGVTVS